MKLANTVAIVTGSSSGIGAAVAVQLAEKGCNVAINYNPHMQGAETVAAQCNALGVETIIHKANVANDDECNRLVEKTLEKFGRIDILINNAGTTKFCNHNDLDGLDKKDFLDIYEVNVAGAYQMTRAAQNALQKAPVAHIINMASIAGLTGVGSSIAYAASKGALITMTLSLARVLGPQIRVNAVCPGFVAGEWLKKGLGEKTFETMKAHYEKISPLGKTATPETVAETVIALVGGTDWTTGETLIIDGGAHLHTAPMRR